MRERCAKVTCSDGRGPVWEEDRLRCFHLQVVHPSTGTITLKESRWVINSACFRGIQPKNRQPADRTRRWLRRLQVIVASLRERASMKTSTQGRIIHDDSLLFLLSEDGTAGLAEASPEEYREISRFSIGEVERKSWSLPVIANGCLYIGDQDKLRCYDARGDSRGRRQEPRTQKLTRNTEATRFVSFIPGHIRLISDGLLLNRRRRSRPAGEGENTKNPENEQASRRLLSRAQSCSPSGVLRSPSCTPAFHSRGARGQGTVCRRNGLRAGRRPERTGDRDERRADGLPVEAAGLHRPLAAD